MVIRNRRAFLSWRRRETNICKLATIGVSLVLAVATIPLAFASIKDSTLLTIYLLFKLWMFVGVPLVLLYIIREEKD